MSKIKPVSVVVRPAATYTVGDGLEARNLFPSNDLGHRISPFLSLDCVGPTYYPPTGHRRGVGEHPHRGFEVVTIMYQGAVEHQDSVGNHGVIGPGDVQWMTAASGVVHEEWHEAEFARRGGTLQLAQLWVNLPGRYKMSSPHYQTLPNGQIPVADLPDNGGVVRVIAGEFRGVVGPAKTFTPVNLYDVRLNAGRLAEIDLPAGYNTAIVALSGRVVVNGSQPLAEVELALLDPQGERAVLEAEGEATLLVLNGEPINEPVAARGPFVMNTPDELRQAVEDYRSGRMGHITAARR